MRIEEFDSADLEELAGVWNSSLLADPISPHRLEPRVLLDPNFREEFSLIAREGDRLIGFALGICGQGIRFPAELVGTGAWILALAVEPAHRGKGVGAALLEELETRFSEAGKRDVWMASYPTPREYGQQKEDEARECAHLMGAQVHFLEYLDGELPDSTEARLGVAGVIRHVRPQVVISHWRASLHPDHAVAHRLAEGAMLWAALEGIGEGLVWRGIRRSVFSENWEDPDGFTPFLFVDVTEYRDAWGTAVQAYELFRGGVSSFDYLRYYDGLGQVRGAQVGVGWAQAFGVAPWAQRQKLDSLTT